MLQRFLDIGQRIKLEKLISLGQVSSLRVQKFAEGIDLLLGHGALGLEGGVNVVDEEVHPQVELQLVLPPQQSEQLQELRSLALGEVPQQLLLEAARRDLPEL